jgi:Tol biopolymer transport system component
MVTGIYPVSNIRVRRFKMKYRTRYYFISLVIVMTTLLLAACGGGNQLTYQVTGAASEAEVTYTDGDGNSHTETVTLPWETSFDVGGSADFALAADNTTEQGNISCAVLLNEKELGRADANYYAACKGSFKKSGGSLSTNFSSSKDVLADGSPAGPQTTATPVPPTATPLPSPTPDLTADFVTFTNKEGTLSFRYPPNWVVLDHGDSIAAISDASLEESFLSGEDYNHSAGFVVGQIGLTGDFDTDDPTVLLKAWLKQVEDEDWQPQPAGELAVSENGTIRRADRAFTGNKDGQDLYFTITGIVNGGSAGVFIGGRTGAAPEEYGVLATAILDTLEPAYLEPEEAAVPLKPTAAPMPELTEVFVKERIVFASDRDGNSEIYTINTDGGRLTRLTDNDVYDGECTWSPDGSKIAFVSKRDGNYEIYTMNVDGSDVTRLTDDPANDFSPAWSPNNQIIAFMTERNGNPDIYLMHADGSGVNPFITSQSKDMSPAWSHTNPELAFVSDQAEDGIFDLYIADTKGQVRRITQGMGKVYTPNWSPNGRYIAFAADDGQNIDIYIIKPDGTDLQQITDDKAKDYLPKWSPDSNYIMFVSERDGNPDIYIANEAGDVQRVTAHMGMDTNPGWGPMGSK